MNGLVLVCHQLRSAENLGSIARAMANFGFADLILADPATHDFRGAERLGVQAESVLEHFSVAPTLEEALKDVVFAVGTTSRTQLKRSDALTPEAGMALLSEHSKRGKVALVLGGEKRGLSDDELGLCQAAIVIPTPGPQPSMNVAQAASVLLYLASRESRAPEPPRNDGARLATIHAMEKKMRDALLACEFLNPQAPEHVLREMTRTLVRQGITQREAEVWLSAFEHVRRVSAADASR